MKTKILKFLTLLFLLFAFDTKANNKFLFEIQPEGIYIDNVNVEVLKKIFSDYKYTEFVRESKKIPPLMLQSMPFDFNSIKSKDERNKLFIQIMTPLVMKVNEDITLENLANRFHMSTSALSKKLSGRIGMDLRMFVNDIRVQKVVQMLDNPENKGKTINEVAFLCGFSSMSTFYRCYKRNYSLHKLDTEESQEE